VGQTTARWIVALAVGATLVIVPIAASSEPLTLRAPDASLHWRGGFEDAVSISEPALYSQPGVCRTLRCEEVFVNVQLAPDTWGRAPGGVQIAIDWFPNEDNDLDLYVYRENGSLAGRSDGVMASTGEAVRLANAENGRYRIVVVPRLVRGSMAYEGLVTVEHDPPRLPVRPLLPNLITLPPRHVELRTGAYYTDPGADDTSSCYPEEIAEQGARRCLRFDQVIANLGEGPLELHYDANGLGSDQPVRQRVYWSNGAYQDFQVDRYEFHPAHAHFHYKNFGQAFLYRRHPDGTLEKIREGRKNGFCMIDVENVRFEGHAVGAPGPGAAPRHYYFPRCNTPAEENEARTVMVNGISTGWADVYNWYLADQYIEISGVPDGDYVLETVAHPARTVHETSVEDNTARIALRLQGERVSIIPG
jgi:Lysyl oxidase